MTEKILSLLNGAALLVFGVYLSAAFLGIRKSWKKRSLLLLCFLCGALQVAGLIFLSEAVVWKIYPLITHLPLALVLCCVFRKRPASVTAAVTAAYLFCQPANWFGILAYSLTGSDTVKYVVRILGLVIMAFLSWKYLAPCLSEIFQKDLVSICIFGAVPAVYYLFDYVTAIYTDLWLKSNRLVAEFLPFVLCIVFVLFCVVYYQQQEKRAAAEQREQIVQIKVEQQAKEHMAIKRAEQELRILRHDMRLFLSGLSVCIGEGDREKAQNMIAAYTEFIEETKLVRFCENDMVNYVLSDFAVKCQAKETSFCHTVELGELKVDELRLSVILSNVLDNALNAQQELPAEKRRICLVLKNAHGKLLLSVENPTNTEPVFVDGLPVTTRKGHGVGTQSVRKLAEQLGGNCLFSCRDHVFTASVSL